jgi:SAM domain (Sterile alpha motif)
MDIGGRLRSLGLERYETAFRENAIDTDVLRELTDEDLEKLGVLLGDRRRLLRAIAELDSASAAAGPPAAVPSAAAAWRWKRKGRCVRKVDRTTSSAPTSAGTRLQPECLGQIASRNMLPLSQHRAPAT